MSAKREAKLEEFLKQYELEDVRDYLENAQIQYGDLKNILTEEDLKEAVPPLGPRLRFREKLLSWRKSILGPDGESQLLPTNIEKSKETPPNLYYKAKQVLGKGLGTLLAETNRGRAILDQGKKQMYLSQNMKNDLISIILEEIFSTGITIKYSDFSLLLDEICCHLPGEEKCKDYYFISRDGKKNPSGKLYSKYKNRRSRIQLNLAQNELFEKYEDLENQTPVVSESDRIALSLKPSLNRDGNNWDLVCPYKII
ncbi:uncharacterized protein LOC119546370 [Drosophila subpulchrella]|uniref:uncharacterized protein LOC119546370 n=1 Tax=Drosophila subpulchrella TaxID=1486046 RepID=UPI0018A13E6A|nr:uncharacterized protein LOC119546370 [Drosophila subpulchrella]